MHVDGLWCLKCIELSPHSEHCFKETLIKYLREQIAALRGTRNLAV